jgi:dienelactone hydrolase
MHKAFLVLLRAAAAALAVCAIAIAFIFTRAVSPAFHTSKGDLRRVSLDPVGTDSLFDRSWLTLESSTGLTVVSGMLTPSLGATPRAAGQRFPAVVLLGGKATGKYAVDYALGIQNIILVAPDYPYEPRASYTVTEFLGDVPAIRQAILDMFPSVMLVIDYLTTRADVDTTKIVLLGYSFGAPFIPAIAASDRRAAAAAIVYGGGGLRRMIRHNVRRYRGPLESELVGSVSGLLLRPVEPLRFAEGISPTPLVMINGTEDEQIPRQCTMALFERAGEPKTLLWIESGHVHPRNVDLTQKIIASLSQELQRLGIFDERQRR